MSISIIWLCSKVIPILLRSVLFFCRKLRNELLYTARRFQSASVYLRKVELYPLLLKYIDQLDQCKGVEKSALEQFTVGRQHGFVTAQLIKYP